MMQFSLRFLPYFAFALVVLAHTSEGLKCYSCNANGTSATDDPCLEPEKNKAPSMDCPAKHLCRKAFFEKDNTMVRDCAPENEENYGKVGCGTKDDSTFCNCNSDLCNSEPGLKVTVGPGGPDTTTGGPESGCPSLISWNWSVQVLFTIAAFLVKL